MYTFTHLQIRVRDEEERTFIRLSGSATFLRLPELNAVLGAVPERREVHVQFDGLDHIDQASLQSIAAWEKQYIARGGRVSVEWDGLEVLAKNRHRRNIATEPAITESE